MPDVDDRLVVPETREEMIRGERLLVTPANPEHADLHTRLDYVINGHVRPGYVASTDLLTRTGRNSDFATDTSIRRAGTDPQTAKRYLEELAFEIANTQTVADLTAKAEDLTARGVRRVFGIFVATEEVKEWIGAWRTLPPEGVIEDRCLLRPVPVRALLSAAAADNAIADALIAKDNPVIAQRGAAQLAEGERRGLRQAITILCEALGVELDPARHASLSRLDLAGLSALLTHLGKQRAWPG